MDFAAVYSVSNRFFSMLFINFFRGLPWFCHFSQTFVGWQEAVQDQQVMSSRSKEKQAEGEEQKKEERAARGGKHTLYTVTYPSICRSTHPSIHLYRSIYRSVDRSI